MSPLGIVQDICTVVQKQLMPEVPKRWSKQVDFGVKAYALRSFASAGSNARKVVENTASTKADRLLANLKLARHLGTVFDVLGLVRPDSFVNIDHTDMNGLMALAGAVQTRRGRAIPCMVETTYSDRLPSHADAPPRKKALRRNRAHERAGLGLTEHTIRSLQAFAKRLGFWPKFVFDRGFCAKEIIRLLCRHEATFYMRMKADRLVELAGAVTVTKALRGHDNTIRLYDYTLRVVRSRKPKGGEPWCILTNDLISTTKRVLRFYRHRFEIKETFKDMKHIFELKHTRLNRPTSLKFILWLVSIGIALLYLVTKDCITDERQHNPKKWRSWIRMGYEQLERTYTMMFWGTATDEV